MGWEARNGSRYYYRKKRIGQRVVSVYIGPGLAGELEASLSELERDRAAAAARLLQDQAAEARALDRDLARLEGYAGAMVKAWALLSGCYPHRGQLRKARKWHMK